MRKAWHIKLNDYLITRDSYGKLACYYFPGNLSEWLKWRHPGGNMDELKAEIEHRRKMLKVLEDLEEVLDHD